MPVKSYKGGNKPKKRHSIPIKNSKKNSVHPKLDLIDNCDKFLSKRINIIFYISLGLLIIFSFLLFDVHAGIGGDDSAYLQRAYDFVHGFKYPGYQGPLYPIILSPFILLFGIQIPLLKLLSLIFMAIASVFFFKTFVNRIPAIILTSILLLVNINYFVLYFSSQTYNEAFFMMVQIIFFWFFTTRFIDDQPSGENGYKKYILLGLLLLIMSITKNIAIFSFLIIVVWFIIYRRWKDAGLSLLSFLGFLALFEIIKRLLWKGQGFQLSSQSSGLMNKNYYVPSLGKEDALGFVQRFIDNSNLYLSKHLFKFLGLVNENSKDIYPVLTIIIYILMAIGIIFVLKKNKLLFLIGIYTLFMTALTFISLQKIWDQWRLIVIYYPFLLLILFSALYYLFKLPYLKFWQFIIPFITIVLFVTEYNVTSNHVKIQQPILVHNLGGDMLYGLKPDWINYIKMSQWAAKNIPENDNIGCRKPEISFVYGGRNFYGIYKVPSFSTDTLVRHILNNSDIYVGLNLKQFDTTKLFAEPELKARIICYINGYFGFGNENSIDDKAIAIFRFTGKEFPEWEERLKQTGFYYEKDIKNWILNSQSISTNYSVYFPDMLMDNLRRNNVRYLIVANLRANPEENNGIILKSVNLYIYFLRLRYKHIFRNIHTIGDEEPAYLIEVNLSK